MHPISYRGLLVCRNNWTLMIPLNTVVPFLPCYTLYIHKTSSGYEIYELSLPKVQKMLLLSFPFRPKLPPRPPPKIQNGRVQNWTNLIQIPNMHKTLLNYGRKITTFRNIWKALKNTELNDNWNSKEKNAQYHPLCHSLHYQKQSQPLFSFHFFSWAADQPNVWKI